MTNEERRNKVINRNITLAPPYIALTWDVIFVWTISTMFFALPEKNLTNSQIIALDSIMMLSGCLICIPVAKIFQKVPPVWASRIGTLGYGIYLLLCIFGTNFITFAIGSVFVSFGYAVNGLKVNSFLTRSLDVVKRNKDYERVFGNGVSIFYFLECVGAIGITYVFSWNPYACYWISFALVVLAEVYSFLLAEPNKFQERNIKLNGKTTQKKLKEEQPEPYAKIIKSSFLIFLLIYMFFVRGILSVTLSGFKVYLQQVINAGAIPLTLFGYIYAGAKLAASITSKFQFKLNLKYGVKTLIVFTGITVLGFVACGCMYLWNPTSIISIIIIIAVTYVMNAIYMPTRIFVNNYLQVCTPTKNIERAYSIRTMVEYLGYAAISAVYALLLGVYNDNYGLTSLVYIAIFGIPLIVSMLLFIRALIKKHAQKYTIIKDEYTKN